MRFEWRRTSPEPMPELWKERPVGRPIHNVWLWARPDGTAYMEYDASSQEELWFFVSQDFASVGEGYNALKSLTPEDLPTRKETVG